VITQNGGSGVFAGALHVVARNCIVAENLGHGIEIYSQYVTHEVTNCTIVNNAGYGLFEVGMPSSGGLVVLNSIIWGNLDGAIYNEGAITVTYSNIQEGYAGQGNISLPPLFVGDGDYHLTADSPSIDKGTSAGAPNIDIDGDPRPQLTGYDMGADEFIPKAGVVIDIRPRSINLQSKGVTVIAILTTVNFDATNTDPFTARFADASPVKWITCDVDRDGDSDLLIRFNTRDLNLTKQSTETTLTAVSYDGASIEGTVSFNIINGRSNELGRPGFSWGRRNPAMPDH
jgi:hypothetical protein